MTTVGAYVGNTPGEVAAMENWLGRPLDFIGAHTGKANWWDWESSISWLATQFKSVDAQKAWSIPMFADGGNLADAGAGKYNDHYLVAAQKLLAASDGNSPIYVRIGEEFNANWMTWSAQGQAGNFIKAYQEFVDTFRTVSDRFKFEWNVNIGDFGMNPADAYPGDKYVDIVGMDFYYNTQWDSKDPLQAWNWMVNEKYGLQWLEDFAKAHGKPTAYSEWGVNSDTAGPYIQKAYEWFAAHNVVYQNYWDSNSGFDGKIDNSQYATAAAAFKAAFGAANVPPVADPVVIPPVVPVVTAPVIDPVVVPPVTDPVVVPPVTDPVVVAPANPTTIFSATSFTLNSTTTNLTLTGSASIDGIGNGLNNILTGNAGDNHLVGKGGNDTLDGGKGADKMEGGLGYDTYYVDNRGDEVIEVGNGHDTVISAISYKLPDLVEDLVLRYSGDSAGTGNALANKITGNEGNNVLDGREGDDTILGGAGNDVIIGGVGNDRLTGGAGTDTFKFGLWSGKDVITDFGSGGHDVLDISAWQAKGYAASLTDTASGVTLSFRTGDSIQLLGVHAADLHTTALGYTI